MLAETYRIAWEKRDRIPTCGDESRPWLFGVARNVLHRERRSAQYDAGAAHDLAAALERTATESPLIDSPVLDTLEALGPLDREIITMLAWDGLRPREVAAILDLTPNVVRIRASRARSQLRAHLTESRSPTDLASLQQSTPTVDRRTQ
jgi:RNA polymerase sigma-70 factor (ECF subfamily)